MLNVWLEKQLFKDVCILSRVDEDEIPSTVPSLHAHSTPGQGSPGQGGGVHFDNLEIAGLLLHYDSFPTYTHTER